MLNDFRRSVDQLVDQACDGEDSADDGAKAGGEVAERFLLLAVLDHDGGQLVGEEDPGHAGFARHQGDCLSVSCHRKLVKEIRN